ncbi:SDR family oxidoreductase [Limnobacter sp.]|uniref:SDR family oxidoreductase n=1 Tax=Limnobacter sp. TaxID=2003368 RepID=UPI002734BBC5|nr:SDR family oxidoreductase [Limnobacter sp.]MDP3187211.1 SDR family oxidoreductase [Limnobacter sp.]
MNSFQSVFKADLFKGKAIVITGGGSGIGRCTAHELASLEADLALVGRKIEKLETVRDEILKTCAVKVSVHSCDIREEDKVAATVADILKEHGKIDHLINNAGGQFPAPLCTINAKGWETVVRNNLTGGFLVAREVYNQHMAKNLGKTDMSITNIIADMWNGMPGMGHSGAARAGMLNFSETASLEWAPVRVNAVAPGFIASSGMDTYPEPMKQTIMQLDKTIPLQRLGLEAEVSGVLTFLCSPAASFISGSCIRIDGAAPNAKRVWPVVGNGQQNPAFNSFHLGGLPDVIQRRDADREAKKAAK